MKAGKAKNYAKRFFSFGAFAYLCTRKNENGTLTEWLGSGLQNRVQQFESARYLTNKSSSPHLESCSYSLQYAMAWITCAMAWITCAMAWIMCAAFLITKHKGQFMCAMSYDYARGVLDNVA